MNSIAKVGKTLALFVVLAGVAIGAGLVIAWYMGNHEVMATVKPGEPILPIVSHPQVAASTVPVTDLVVPPPERGWTNPAPEAVTMPWNDKLDEILMRGGEPNDASDGLLKLLAITPPENYGDVVPHLLNMTQDDHYDGVAALLTNAATPTAILTPLMNDLLNRQNTLKLPMLLAVARDENHPLKDQAKDMLELFLQADYATNWDQWQSAVADWLQQNQ